MASFGRKMAGEGKEEEEQNKKLCRKLFVLKIFTRLNNRCCVDIYSQKHWVFLPKNDAIVNLQDKLNILSIQNLNLITSTD